MKRLVPSPAMVVALLALAIASAGSAEAFSSASTPFVRVYQNVVVHRGDVAVASADCPSGYHVVRGGYSTQQGREVIPIAAYYAKDLGSYQVGVLAPPGVRSAPVSVVKVSADCEQ
jgi:hypothetical protein